MLLTHLTVREDAHLLYGFGTRRRARCLPPADQDHRRRRAHALSILSGMTVADLAQAITLQEAGRLTKMPGIGKKTAERLLLELKGKLGADLGAAGGVGASDAASPISSMRCWRWATPTRKRMLALKQRAGRQRRVRRHQAGAESPVQSIESVSSRTCT